MKKDRKNILKKCVSVFVFILLTFAIYGYMIIVFMPKSEKDYKGLSYYSYADLKTEAKDSIDVMVFGNSDAYSGFSPMEFYRQTGATSFVLAGPKESICNVESNIRSAIKYQSPKLIIIDVDLFFYKNKRDTGTTLLKQLPYTAPFRLHSRWKNLKFKDFVTLPTVKESKLKGFYFRTNTAKFKKPNGYMEKVNASPAKIEKSVIKNFENILNLCKDKGIYLELIELPSPSSWNNAKSNAITKLAKEYEVPYLDLNLPQEGYDLDYTTSFFDKGNHLNVTGATYTTIYLSKYLERYKLPNHKDEQSYKRWNELLDEYDEMLNEYYEMLKNKA